MSIQAVAWALEVSVGSVVKRVVLIGIANHADDQGRDAFPSVATLAKYACVSERTVQRTLRELEDDGLISQGDPTLRDVVVERPDHRPNVYDLTVSRGDTVTPRLANGVTKTAERGDTGVTRTVPKPYEEEASSSSGDSVQFADFHAKRAVEAVDMRRRKGLVVKSRIGLAKTIAQDPDFIEESKRIWAHRDCTKCKGKGVIEEYSPGAGTRHMTCVESTLV